VRGSTWVVACTLGCAVAACGGRSARQESSGAGAERGGSSGGGITSGGTTSGGSSSGGRGGSGATAGTSMGGVGIGGGSGDAGNTGGEAGAADTPTEASRLAAGSAHTCAVWPDRTVRCWGRNDRGQLGDGTTVSHVAPEPVAGLRDVVQISAGVSQTCVLIADGSVHCWGWDEWGALGDGEASYAPQPVPTAVVGLADAVQISLGNYHSCAVLRDGTARCWGLNRSSELGDGTTVMRASPIEVAGLEGVVEIAAGQDFTCALLQDGTVRFWGAAFDVFGQLDTTPVIVPGLDDVVALDAGASNVCARRAGGGVHCWGDSAPIAPAPIEVPELRDAVQVATGGSACGRYASGEIRCLGVWNPLVGPVRGAVELAVGFQHACVRLEDESFRCWGYNSDGQATAGGCCHGGLCGIPDGVACGDAGTCAAQWCSGCGGEGEPCCDRARAAEERCRPEAPLCEFETCTSCGGVGEPCCEGSSCETGAVCFENRCSTPGEPGAPCLPGDVCRGGCCVLAEHSDRVCVAIGAPCPGTGGAGLCDAAGSCGGCGAGGEPCCRTESTRIELYCSAPGVACDAGVCGAAP